jgi:hypothetical protein
MIDVNTVKSEGVPNMLEQPTDGESEGEDGELLLSQNNLSFFNIFFLNVFIS